MGLVLDTFRVASAVAASTASKLLEMELEGLRDSREPGTGERVPRAVFKGQLGLAVSPLVTAGLHALGVRDGDEVVVLKLWDRSAHPQDLDAGETRLHGQSEPLVCVRLLGDRIEVRVGLAANELRLAPDATGYQGKSVARVDDTVGAGTLTGSSPSGPVTFTYTPPGGAPVVSPTATLSGVITSGAPKVKA